VTSRSTRCPTTDAAGTTDSGDPMGHSPGPSPFRAGVARELAMDAIRRSSAEHVTVPVGTR
jgi:hypothetical protein